MYRHTNMRYILYVHRHTNMQYICIQTHKHHGTFCTYRHTNMQYILYVQTHKHAVQSLRTDTQTCSTSVCSAPLPPIHCLDIWCGSGWQAVIRGQRDKLRAMSNKQYHCLPWHTQRWCMNIKFYVGKRPFMASSTSARYVRSLWVDLGLHQRTEG